MTKLRDPALLLAALLFSGCGREPENATPPNIVLVTIDALRADYLSSAGHHHKTTPYLDRLAKNGVLFSQAITSFPGTPPTMPSLMTGLFPNFEGIERWTTATKDGFSDLRSPRESRGPEISDNLRMLAEILGEHGYTNLGFNTNLNLSRNHNFHQGFDEYIQFDHYRERMRKTRSHRLEGVYPPADLVTRRVLDRVTEVGTVPLIIWIHYMEPHSPYLPPQKFARRFPRNYTDLDDLEINEAVYDLRFTKRGTPDATRKLDSPEAMGLDREAFTDHVKGLYEGEIRFCDAQIKRLFSGLESIIDWSNTLVVVTSDHGEEFLEHGYVLHNQWGGLPEELLRVPLIVRLPGSRPERNRVDDLVRIVDIAPTILDFAGLSEEAAGMDGESLRPLIQGRESAPRVAYLSTIKYGIVRTERWKYRLTKAVEGDNPPREDLFEITVDPMETTDVAADHPEVLSSLRALWTDFARHLEGRSPSRPSPAAAPEPEIDSDTVEELEALGYIAQ